MKNAHLYYGKKFYLVRLPSENVGKWENANDAEKLLQPQKELRKYSLSQRAQGKASFFLIYRQQTRLSGQWRELKMREHLFFYFLSHANTGELA